jgi:hypothetical protein
MTNWRVANRGGPKVKVNESNQRTNPRANFRTQATTCQNLNKMAEVWTGKIGKIPRVKPVPLTAR